MKLSAIFVVVAWTLPGATSGFSSLSTFTRTTIDNSKVIMSSFATKKTTTTTRSLWTMYDTSNNPPASTPSFNAWSVLAKTEKWISETLASTNAQMNSRNSNSESTNNNDPPSSSVNNPYTRKEVEYACETARDSPMIAASVFRRLKEVRELGERHGQAQEQLAEDFGSSYDPRTFRKTQVIVVPGNNILLQNFSIFDRLIETINQARRNARDYVTDVALERLDNMSDEDDDDDEAQRMWSVSVNLAHLHPKFGENTPQQQLQQMKQEDAASKAGGQEEVDVNYLEYQERKMLARRSPYPTLVLEVRAQPPPDFGQSPPPPPPPSSPTITSRGAETKAAADEGRVSRADIQRLEALFGKSPAFHHPTIERSKQEEEDDFYNAIGKSIQEVSSVTPLRLAQEWMAQNDPEIHETTSGAVVFTESDTPHVDAAYEFIFTNVAMMKEAAAAAAMAAAGQANTSTNRKHARQYLVMPHFLSSSATSFEKLALEVKKMLQVLPDRFCNKLTIDTFHPEHVDAAKRSPMPVYVLMEEQSQTKL